MQGTIEPRMVFIVKMLPSSSLCSSTPDKDDMHAETSLVLLLRRWFGGAGCREERGRDAHTTRWEPLQLLSRAGRER